ncbi:hypothetical protein PsorP6_015373 [Peronosclerospora sorghi]|uniref:Uncharacterized protein n=1 Tax=Peronosclerospora sorghi TaxID=230839 RepID=A0ACC0WQF9_9STRA|nr:hypothetical protein PsorP6_015373 [Peronosclerospora sorghi]
MSRMSPFWNPVFQETKNNLLMVCRDTPTWSHYFLNRDTPQACIQPNNEILGCFFRVGFLEVERDVLVVLACPLFGDVVEALEEGSDNNIYSKRSFHINGPVETSFKSKWVRQASTAPPLLGIQEDGSVQGRKTSRERRSQLNLVFSTHGIDYLAIMRSTNRRLFFLMPLIFTVRILMLFHDEASAASGPPTTNTTAPSTTWSFNTEASSE